MNLSYFIKIAIIKLNFFQFLASVESNAWLTVSFFFLKKIILEI